jgi:hypothetical protein
MNRQPKLYRPQIPMPAPLRGGSSPIATVLGLADERIVVLGEERD